MRWAQRLKRVFTIDIETCRDCGGAVKVMACIEDP
jgi:rRNA maturation protein Nop10